MPESLPDHAKKCIDRYDAHALVALERTREEKQQENRRRLKSRFVDGSLLILPLRQFQMSFDPGRNAPIEGIGTVYGNLVVSDTWGKFRSTGEALISSDYQHLLVPVDASFAETELRGKDWALELDGDWAVKSTGDKIQWTIEQRK